MKVWYDTEFHERGPDYPIDLISIGMVREDGQELYLVNADADYDAAWANEWLRDHVLNQLPSKGILDFGRRWLIDDADPHVVGRKDIASQVSGFLAVPDVELWAWYGAYDHVVLAQLFGRMVDLPPHIPMFTMDLRQEVHRLGNPQMPEQPAGAHNALMDALWLSTRHRWLMAKAAPE